MINKYNTPDGSYTTERTGLLLQKKRLQFHRNYNLISYMRYTHYLIHDRCITLNASIYFLRNLRLSCTILSVNLRPIMCVTIHSLIS